ncbi:serine/threonine-protein kinase [Streptomyces marispadix]|uniref:non-specific serine/threonine protein kinase n=1 Tax=Streptomyces marispadix TaxID=2922868 RepID=A0ABS9SWG1_9ACTN|nr:serine/threonine-protein kinase [Streptomyces marispadix]MCH6160586.1 serine/threonine protein kinase [Streptomyces marispadix]
MARKIGSRYTAHRILGRGSAGTVWLGEGPDGPVAIKLLREDLASDEDLVERFVQERSALLCLDHPSVVGVRDLVVDGSDLALVMQLVRGTDLRTRLEHDRRIAPQPAVSIAADVADGLAAAHAAGIVHRDVKPENVLLDALAPAGPGGAPPALLTDFGVAKLIDSPRTTRATSIIGTPDYLAPEIVEGLPPRASVDIYALATVLYELLAGFTPFGGGHPGAVLRRHVTESVAPLPGIPDELWLLIHQCLAKAPASRLRAVEVAARLRELLPDLEGLPPLDIDEQPEDSYDSYGSYDYGETSGPGGEYGSDAAYGEGHAEARTGGGTVPDQHGRTAATTAAGHGAGRQSAGAGHSGPGQSGPGHPGSGDSGSGHGHGTAASGRPRRAAVPLVHGGASPDSNRDTHTSMRVPGADELAGGAHGTARAPRAAGEPRAGSARNPLSAAAARRRRIKLGAGAAVIAAVAGFGGWLAASGDDGETTQPAPAVEHPEQP